MNYINFPHKLWLYIVLMVPILSCQGQVKTKNNATKMNTSTTKAPITNAIHPEGTEIITLGAGCFWCIEAVFQDLKGVVSATSGYSGGTVVNPSYKEVCTAQTGHAEVVQVTFDPKIVSLPEILEVFWQVHDPTTLNRQGNDAGTQYRSAIFFHNDYQRKIAEEYKIKLDESHAFENPIVTEITAFSNYYKAEDYHQDYYNQNGDQPYCQFVVKPKLDKFHKVFKDKLKN